jgi:hypothetical protein
MLAQWPHLFDLTLLKRMSCYDVTIVTDDDVEMPGFVVDDRPIDDSISPIFADRLSFSQQLEDELWYSIACDPPVGELSLVVLQNVCQPRTFFTAFPCSRKTIRPSGMRSMRTIASGVGFTPWRRNAVTRSAGVSSAPPAPRIQSPASGFAKPATLGPGVAPTHGSRRPAFHLQIRDDGVGIAYEDQTRITDVERRELDKAAKAAFMYAR